MVCNCPHHPHSTRIAIARECQTHEEQLIAFIEHDDIKGVRRKLAAGARVNGCKKEGYHPIMTAVEEGNVAITRLLIKEGANVDSAVPKEALYSDGNIARTAGTRPLHVAARDLELGVFRVLVQAGAAVNPQDANGVTPLISALADEGGKDEKKRQTRIVLIRELMEAGADLTLQDKDGRSATHYAACLEDPEPLKMLLWKMPESLNSLATGGFSPLFMAARNGRAKNVSQLLTMGANQPPRHCYSVTCSCNTQCPLRVAACEGHLDALRVLIDGVESIGGLEATIPSAIQVTCTSASNAYGGRSENPEKWTKILQVLLAVEGEERQGRWARRWFTHSPLLHHAAVSGTPATLRLLLAAGADETALNETGRTASEVMCDQHDGQRMNGPAEKATTLRILARGPAFRARSWTWPVVDGLADVDASPSALGVRIWPSSGSRKCFVRLIGRHALKGTTAAKDEAMVRCNPVHDELG
eukprot:g2566.t1